MTPLYILGILAVFLVFAFIKRRFVPIAIGLALTSLVIFLSIMIFGFLPDYSNGVRAGLVQKYSVKGVIFKSNEFILILPIEGMIMNEGQLNVIEISCVPRHSPEACAELQKAVGTREKMLVEYREWLVKPVSQDSVYTVRSAIPIRAK